MNNFRCLATKEQVMTIHSHVPNPLPNPEIGEEGYEMWCLAAEYRPKWLASLEDPTSHFTQLQSHYNRIVEDVYDRLVKPEPTRHQKDLALGIAHGSARQAIVKTLPPREVQKPAWDHLDPMEDPTLDDPVAPLGAPQDWTPTEPTLSELMHEEITKNS